MVSFFLAVWTSFWQLPAVDKMTTVLALGGPFPLIYAWLRSVFRKRTRFLKDEIEGLQRQVSSLKSQSVILQDDLRRRAEEADHYKRQLPITALTEAAQERKDGNEERAIGVLRDNFETNKGPFAKIAAELAGHHTSLIPDLGAHHLGEAMRLNQIAGALMPDDREVSAFATELLEAEAELAHAAGHYDPLDNKWDDSRFFMYLASTADAEAAFDALVQEGLKKLRKGHYRSAERLLGRAGSLGERILGPLEEDVVFVRLRWFQTLHLMDRPSDHIVEMATSLRDRLGPSSSLGAGAEYYAIESLVSLGRFDEALPRVRRNIEIWTGLVGDDDFETRANRFLCARLLGASGDLIAGIQMLDDVLSRGMLKSTENEIEQSFSGRILRCEFLSRLERPDALSEIDTLISEATEVFEDRHPILLRARVVRLETEFSLDRYDEIRTYVDELVEDLENSVREDANLTIVARMYRAGSLANTQEISSGLEELNELIDESKHRKSMRILLDIKQMHAEALLNAGKLEALEEYINEIVKEKTEILGETHWKTIDALLLRAETQLRLGRRDEARLALQQIIPEIENLPNLPRSRGKVAADLLDRSRVATSDQECPR